MYNLIIIIFSLLKAEVKFINNDTSIPKTFDLVNFITL